ncbi:MAG TPA: hypothetical protein VLO10_06555 [Candidatus Deferrimicrobium sp.]|nr:hypothetical protein [Candidatus Deferrimicrobium sp.]
MGPRSARGRALFGLDLFLGVTAFVGGIALFVGWIRMPLTFLAGSPFSDFTIPAVLLTVVVGGGGLLAAWTVHRRSDLGSVTSGIAAGAVSVFEAVEWSVIGFNPLQILYLLVGASILVAVLRIEMVDHPVRRWLSTRKHPRHAAYPR